MSPSHSSTVLKFLLAFLLVCSLTPVLLASPQVPVTAAAPTFLIVPGAWHSPSHYNYLISHLKASGYNAVSSRNPSCNSTDPNAESVTKDADFIRKHVMTLLNSGQDVVLVMHSYGSIPASTAVKGLSKAERTAAGNLGGILGIICICGLLLQEGQSLKSSLPGDKYADWVVEKPDGQLSTRTPREIFYGDVPTDLADFAIAALRDQSEHSLSSPSGPPAWADPYYNGRRSYAKTLQDRGLPAVAQDLMTKHCGVVWEVRAFDTSHSPFLSRPKELADWMIGELRRYAAAESIGALRGGSQRLGLAAPLKGLGKDVETSK